MLCGVAKHRATATLFCPTVLPLLIERFLDIKISLVADKRSSSSTPEKNIRFFVHPIATASLLAPSDPGAFDSDGIAGRSLWGADWIRHPAACQ